MSNMAKSKKVQVNLTGDALDTLERLRTELDMPMGEVIKEALGLYGWTADRIQQGESLGIITDNGNKVTEIVMPRLRKKR